MSHSRTRKPDRRAFTLIELMLVIAILLVLGTVSVTAYMRVQAGARKKAAKLLVDDAVNAINLYQIALSKYPTNDEGLQALITVPDDEKEAQKWRDGGGPFLREPKIPIDPWNNELKYALREGADSDLGPPFRVFSYGPDGQEGTDDDISSYEEKTGL